MSQHANKTLEELAAEQITLGQVDGERLNAMSALILRNGTLDDQEVSILRKMILSTCTAANEQIGRVNVEFIFTLNEASAVKRNEDIWKAFFIEVIAMHVFNDELSPNAIDEEEALWLIDMLERDGKYDANEIALLEHLHAHAHDMPMGIKFRLGMILAVS